MLDVVLPVDSRDTSLTTTQERYYYEFTIDRDGISNELLQVYRSARPTTLLERTRTQQGKPIMKTAPGTGEVFDVGARELALSRALVTEHEYFAGIATAFLGGMETFNVGDTEPSSRLRKITEELAAGTISTQDLVTLAQMADIGIRDIRVDEREPPEADEGGLLSLVDESAGTLAWLAIAVPIIAALRNGRLLCVDELDTSLHPHLVIEIVRLFQNFETNPHGAQLIFTTHDVTMLMPQSELGLRSNQVWIVEKTTDGASELYSLGDFTDLKEKSNIAKQFLEGRFGGTPRLTPAIVYSLVASVPVEER